MKILITGGAGYTGVPLAARLLERGHTVTIVDNFLYGYDSILHLVAHPGLVVVKTDIRNEDRSWLKGQDVIYHLAAISGYPACEANPNSARLINVDATRAVAEALDPEQFLVYASTTSFYGSKGERASEDMAVRPVSLYGATKWEAERIVMDRENSIALRWATVFGVGPRMRAGLLVNDFCEKAVTERAIVLYDADSTRTFMHVSDLVNGYLFALDRLEAMRGDVFNMGSERLNYTKRQIAEHICARQPCDLIDASFGDADVRDFLVSFNKAAALGFDCTVSLEDGVTKLLKLYRFYAPHSFIRPI